MTISDLATPVAPAGGLDSAPLELAPLELAQRLTDLADLLGATDLRPGPEVDRAFGELVGLSLAPHHGVVRAGQAAEVMRLLGPRVAEIRDLCARGETELETCWAQRILAAADPVAELDRFPYLGNYRALVALELAAVRGLGEEPRTAVVVGSGPLPLTGLVLARDHGLDVTLVDRDADSLALGDRVAAALGVPGVTSRLADVSGEVPGPALAALAGADLVVHAALVGSDGLQKHRALSRVAEAMRPGAHVVVRSAAGLRELLYAPASVDDVACLSLQLELHPHHEVVNSALVARRDGSAA
ncbi:nicotianamine synthase family protein [Nocardioides sp. GCM10027113]|uniref:nicotianamine synthase family protein n=1 Tax=unclassified Nocardioides TaxID=2615069 RepID=UPI0036123093